MNTTTETVQHTPTPWCICGKSRHGNPIIFQDAKIVEDLCVEVFHGSPVTAQANAAFIVRACNNHEALVAALRSLVGQDLTYLDNSILVPCANSMNALKRVQDARAALKAATQ